jgi:hypothetical protein
MTYVPRHKPFQHQADYLTKHGRKESFGLFWEQGCGKTKAVIDTLGTRS